jgi:hypothetical protein
VGDLRLEAGCLESLALKVLAQPGRLAYAGARREALALPEAAFRWAAHRALFRLLGSAAAEGRVLTAEELRHLAPQAELDGVDLKSLFGPLGAGPATVRQRLRSWRRSVEGVFF